jgi:hypothetical protein
MKHNIISYSFVAVWKKPIIQIPILDNKFCKDLFDDPYNTNAGLTHEGFTINLSSAKIPNPAVIINNQKIVIISYDLEQVKKTITKISSELKKFNALSLNIGAIGINTEHEFIEIGEKTTTFLANRFVLPGLKVNPTHKDYILSLTDLNFQIVASSNERYNILIQPRANQLDGIFLSINAHLQTEYENIPDVNEINELFANTLENLDNNIFTLIL